MTAPTFGDSVRRWRDARGMTQHQLATLVGRSAQMISAIENGRRQIHIDELPRFAEALEVSPASLIGIAEGDRYTEGYQAGWKAAFDELAEYAASRASIEP